MSSLRRYAPGFVKHVVWNWKYRSAGIHPEECPRSLLERLRTLEPDARVLDLGCGPGNLRAALRLCGWNGRYIGCDVSEQAIATANRSGDTNAEWHVSTIEDFPTLDEKVNTICLCESIYYVRVGLVPALLERCRESLISPGGQILIRIWHVDQHREYIALLARMGAEAAPPVYTLYS
jgi:2-polyprenyl-3-methyl-5-hydroxy-6-metoxy-1,4-benzoquinol methylase